jgi:hypothetical protein
MELGPIGHTKMKGATKHESGPLETVTIEGWNQDRWIFIRNVGFNTIQSYQVITGRPTNNTLEKSFPSKKNKVTLIKLHSHLVLGTLVLNPPNTMLVI